MIILNLMKLIIYNSLIYVVLFANEFILFIFLPCYLPSIVMLVDLILVLTSFEVDKNHYSFVELLWISKYFGSGILIICKNVNVTRVIH